MIALNFGTVAGLTGPEQKALDELVQVYSLHQAGNAEKEKYYEGHVALKDVNLGIALPQGIRNLEVGCSWGQKAVDVLAARSMFDGFVSSGGDNAVLNRLIADNRLIAEYGKACRDELKYGCAFATLSLRMTPSVARYDSTPLPRRQRCGAARRGALPAGWRSLTPCRMSI